MADSPSFALQQKIRWKAQFSLSAALMYGFANLMPHTFFDIIAVSILFLGCKHYWFHLLTAHTRTHTRKQTGLTHTHSAVWLLLLAFPGFCVYIIDLFSIFARLHFVALLIDIYIFYITHGLPLFTAFSHSYSPFMND